VEGFISDIQVKGSRKTQKRLKTTSLRKFRSGTTTHTQVLNNGGLIHMYALTRMARW